LRVYLFILSVRRGVLKRNIRSLEGAGRFPSYRVKDSLPSATVPFLQIALRDSLFLEVVRSLFTQNL